MVVAFQTVLSRAIEIVEQGYQLIELVFRRPYERFIRALANDLKLCMI